MSTSEKSQHEHARELGAIVRKMVCGSIFLELLTNERGIRLNQEGERRFFIGLLCESPEDIEASYPAHTPVDPFSIGYGLSKFWTASNNVHGFRLRPKLAVMLWQKYRLTVPALRPYFSSPVEGLEFSYIDIFNLLEHERPALEKPQNINYQNKTLNEAESQAEQWARAFFQTARIPAHIREQFIDRDPVKEFLQNAKAASEETLSEQAEQTAEAFEWESDLKKRRYYEYRWCSICRRAFLTDKEQQRACLLFFDSLMTEIQDVDREAEKYKCAEKTLRRWVLVGTVLAIGINSLNTYIVNFVNNDTLKLFISALALFATALSRTELFCRSSDKRDTNKETWLRHSLNRFRLTTEVEHFFAGKNDYRAVWEEDPAAIRECIILFMSRVNEWRTEDYRNFYVNMNCINFTENKSSPESADALPDKLALSAADVDGIPGNPVYEP